jgi:hypothetical protein
MKPDHLPFLAALPVPDLPDWVPASVRHYIDHVAGGRTLRDVARREGRNASTILRHVRKWEMRRDEALVDEALDILAVHDPFPAPDQEDSMTKHSRPDSLIKPQDVEREARRVLRRLAETGAFLAVADGMDKAAVLRDTGQGTPTRVAIVARRVVMAFAVQDWIECTRNGRVATYRITEAGRAVLKRLLAAQAEAEALGFGEKPDPFRAQHAEWGEKTVAGPDGQVRRMRYNLAESPFTALGRRPGPDGKPFLSADLIHAGELLREDFELAQMGPRITQNWDRFLTGGRNGGFGDSGIAEGPGAARERVAAALRDLGPGLGDIALRCCCFLEGLEAAEKRMGWSARSGKIVLRIALQRLKVHYDERGGRRGGRAQRLVSVIRRRT